MTENQAMLIVAEQVAKEQGYIEVSKNTLNALRDRFWGQQGGGCNGWQARSDNNLQVHPPDARGGQGQKQAQTQD